MTERLHFLYFLAPEAGSGMWVSGQGPRPSAQAYHPPLLRKEAGPAGLGLRSSVSESQGVVPGFPCLQ